jgi:hypothetical protein
MGRGGAAVTGGQIAEEDVMRIRSDASIRVAAALGLALAVAIAGCSRPMPGPGAPPTVGPSKTPTPTSATAPPGVGTWRTIATAPIAAGYYTGAWTGSELIIHAPSYEDVPSPVGSIDVAYNPATNTWRRLPSSPYPVVAVEGGYHAVWIGSEMLAFGSMDAAYSPVTNTWRPLPPGPAGASAVVWTGQHVIMWGGGCCSMNTADGAAFDVARGVWEPIPRAPLAARHAPGVWTGTEMIVVGGANLTSDFADGAAYDPATRTWRKLPPMPVPVADQTLTWTGTEVLVVGGTRSVGDTITVSAAALAYNPSTNTWRRLADMPMPRHRHVAVWTGDQLLVWGGKSASPTSSTPSAPPYGVVYDPATDRWSAMPPSPLKAHTDAIAAWTGTELIIWGGLGVATSTMLGDGAAFQPARQKPA